MLFAFVLALVQNVPAETVAPVVAGIGITAAALIALMRKHRIKNKELAEQIAKFKRGYQARVVAIKRDLVQWLAQNTSFADHGEASKALLELAFERYLDIHDEEDARDFIERAFRRAVQRRRGPLQ